MNSYEVIGITEIYPKNCRYMPGKAELQIEGYELFLSESTNLSKRGAICILPTGYLPPIPHFYS
jgi:hypothetical protein